jgi:hypothetical protein
MRICVITSRRGAQIPEMRANSQGLRLICTADLPTDTLSFAVDNCSSPVDLSALTFQIPD